MKTSGTVVFITLTLQYILKVVTNIFCSLQRVHTSNFSRIGKSKLFCAKSRQLFQSDFHRGPSCEKPLRLRSAHFHFFQQGTDLGQPLAGESRMLALPHSDSRRTQQRPHRALSIAAPTRCRIHTSRHKERPVSVSGLSP